MDSTMYTIGEFAAFGHVSARMLRHYDAIGLLRPADVDERSGYRRYPPEQIGDLVRIVELRDNVTPVIDRILPPLIDALKDSGVEFREPGIFWYEPVEGSDDLRVWVSWIAGDEPVEGDAWQIVTLPAVERAVSHTYHGDMAGIGLAWHEVMKTAADAGDVFTGPCREVYLYSDGPQSEWITELQQPVV